MSNWTEKYILLLARNFEKQAADLKKANFPKSLFRYRTLNENTLNVLSNFAVWMSSAEKLNDPYELTIVYNEDDFNKTFFSQQDFYSTFQKLTKKEISKEEVEEIINSEDADLKFKEICERKGFVWKLSRPKAIRQKALDTFQEYMRKRIKVCSFSERNDSILMWSHYANEHKGICIEYDFKNDNDIFNVLEPVFYAEAGFDLTPYIFNVLENSRILKISAITKAKDWEYEKEWRIIFPNYIDTDGGYHIVPLPKQIYLGTRFEENDEKLKEAFYNFANKFSIPIVKMVIDKKGYKVNHE